MYRTEHYISCSQGPNNFFKIFHQSCKLSERIAFRQHGSSTPTIHCISFYFFAKISYIFMYEFLFDALELSFTSFAHIFFFIFSSILIAFLIVGFLTYLRFLTPSYALRQTKPSSSTVWSVYYYLLQPSTQFEFVPISFEYPPPNSAFLFLIFKNINR